MVTKEFLHKQRPLIFFYFLLRSVIRHYRDLCARLLCKSSRFFRSAVFSPVSKIVSIREVSQSTVNVVRIYPSV